MPSAERYHSSTRADGKLVHRWRGRYTDAAGRKRSRTFDTKTAALRWAGAEEAKVERGQRSDPTSARMRWGDWCDRWFPAKRLEPSTRAGQQSRIDVHVRPRWGDTPLIQISRLDVQAWVNDLETRLSPSMVRQCYRVLSSSLATAAAEGILASNPCVKITLPTEPVHNERFLTDGESAELLRFLDGPYRVLVELMLGTGLRVAEACGLHVDRVDLERARIDVVEVFDYQRREMRGYPKSKRRRSVPLPPELVDLLRSHLHAHPPAKRCGKPHRGGRCPGGLILTGRNGAPIDPSNFEQRQWRAAAMHAGLAVEDGHRKDGARKWRLTATPHSCRHTYASRLVQLGVSIEKVQLLLGHESLSTTQRYARFADADGWDEVRGALSQVSAGRASHGTNDGPTPEDEPTRPDTRRRRLRAV